jgi:sulfur-carrier protein
MKAEQPAAAATIRVVLPYHLKTLARVDSEVRLTVEGTVTQRSVLAALERRYPMLQGTIVDHVTGQRRPKIRLFACREDLSHQSQDAPLPEAVRDGKEAFIILGAIAGG